MIVDQFFDSDRLDKVHAKHEDDKISPLDTLQTKRLPNKPLDTTSESICSYGITIDANAEKCLIGNFLYHLISESLDVRDTASRSPVVSKR